MTLPLGQPLGSGYQHGTVPVPSIPSRPKASLSPYPLPDHILPPSVFSDNETHSQGAFQPPFASASSVPEGIFAVPKDTPLTLQNVYRAPGAVSVGVIPSPSPTRLGVPFEDGFPCYVLPVKPMSLPRFPEQSEQLCSHKTTQTLSEQQESTLHGRCRKAPEAKVFPRPVGRPRKFPQPKGPPLPVGRPRKASEPKLPPRPVRRPHKSMLSIISSTPELSSTETDSEVWSASRTAPLVSCSLSERDEAQSFDSASGVPTGDGSKVEPSAGDRVGRLSEQTGVDFHSQLPSHPNAEAPILSYPPAPAQSDAPASAVSTQVSRLAPDFHERPSVPVAYPVIGDMFESLDAFKEACWTASWAAGHDMRFSSSHIFACQHHSRPTYCPFKIVICGNKLPAEKWQVVGVEMQHRNHSFKPGDIDPASTRGWRILSAKGALTQQTPQAPARPRLSLGSPSPTVLKQTKLSEQFGNPTGTSHLKRKLSSSASAGDGKGTSSAGSSGSSNRTKTSAPSKKIDP